MRSLALVAGILAAVGVLPLRTAYAACGEECDGQYSSAIDDCRSQYGDDPADADDLTSCVQQAKNDYRSCLDDCASAAISVPLWLGSVVSPFVMPPRSVCRGPVRK